MPYWVEGVTVPGVAGQLGVEVPGSARDAKAAHQKGFQDDGLLLSFVLPSGDVDAFVDSLAPEQPLLVRARPLDGAVPPMTPFSRLGLAEPETLADVREGQVCAPCRGELNSLDVAVVPLDGRAGRVDGGYRVYLRGVD
ncbi:hypothetical protein [Streptomyces sp. NPDC048659]|uniref:hypothetical protein n=1 Tax=Streptomyces sp. NPDC048659 TaxID=3155489 RepID=UPI00343BBA72